MMQEQSHQSESAPRRQWWRDETTANPQVGPVAVQAPTAVEDAAVVSDIGQELEEEAIKRAAARATGERIEFFHFPTKLPAVYRRLGWFSVFFALFYGVFPICFHNPFLLPIWLVLIYQQALRIVSAKRSATQAKQPQLIFALTLEGIVFYATGVAAMLKRWEDLTHVASVKNRKLVVKSSPAVTGNSNAINSERGIGIRLKNPLVVLLESPLVCCLDPAYPYPIDVDGLVSRITAFRREHNV